MIAEPIEDLVRLLARLPGLGPRSARRATLALLKRPDTLLAPLAAALERCAREVRRCAQCGNLDLSDPCAICRDPDRDPTQILVVEGIEDLWAMERTGTFKGRYHVLGGTLSAIDAVGPEELGVDRLLRRVAETPGVEVILALSATVAGQTTAHYLARRLAGSGARITRLGYGLPVGGELNYLDEGTLRAAFEARRPLL
ncbi:MAG: recombination mediator RecR [Geminicoccaceae bacterium]|nr:recombination mediator RecR [Geminicoccaceae bacterium]MCX7629907.1 recombination mediator RecR [Geminicoccaceae bacterium]MDW8342539.1 recombination mediator RecR [Geminicoccaceae bacterium]